MSRLNCRLFLLNFWCGQQSVKITNGVEEEHMVVDAYTLLRLIFTNAIRMKKSSIRSVGLCEYSVGCYCLISWNCWSLNPSVPEGSRNAVPCYGFGDRETNDTSVFTFLGGRDCILGLPYEGVQARYVICRVEGCNMTHSYHRYRDVVPHVVMAGPASFAPLIHQSLAIVNETGEFHVLFIIASGHLAGSSRELLAELDVNEQKTIDAIKLASHFPLSIVIVGVGDGPWDGMKQYKRFLHNRKFDNLHFVDYEVRVTQFL